MLTSVVLMMSSPACFKLMNRYLHLNQTAEIIKSSIAPSATVYGFPDGGFFVDIPNAAGVKTYRERMAASFAVSNGTSGVDPACKAIVGKENTVECLFAKRMIATLNTPLFGLEAQYDA